MPTIRHGYEFFYDHSDHYWGARFALDALRQYVNSQPNAKPAHFMYSGYNVEGYNKPAAHLSIGDRCFKQSMFYAYAQQDGLSADTGGGFTGFGYVSLSYQEKRCGTNGVIVIGDNPSCLAPVK